MKSPADGTESLSVLSVSRGPPRNSLAEFVNNISSIQRLIDIAWQVRGLVLPALVITRTIGSALSPHANVGGSFDRVMI
jgi:hypothetical protein